MQKKSQLFMGGFGRNQPKQPSRIEGLGKRKGIQTKEKPRRGQGKNDLRLNTDPQTHKRKQEGGSTMDPGNHQGNKDNKEKIQIEAATKWGRRKKEKKQRKQKKLLDTEKDKRGKKYKKRQKQIEYNLERKL